MLSRAKKVIYSPRMLACLWHYRTRKSEEIWRLFRRYVWICQRRDAFDWFSRSIRSAYWWSTPETTFDIRI